MTIFGQDCLHRDAVEYYYGFVDQHMADVPDHIVRHVRQCRLCRSQIRRLQEVAARAMGEGDVPRDEMNRDIIDILNSHFQCVGESVTCARAKPFLPSLLLSAPRVRIPTPITVHVDHCPPCAADLRRLGELGLEDEQWDRLSRLYREKPAGDRALCQQARLKIPAFAAASLEGLDARLVHHLCTCPECRAQVYQYRAKLLEPLAPAGADAAVGGGHISTAEAFDYVVACDLTSGATSRVQTRPAVTGAHVRQCRRCLEKIQALHRAVYSVAERTDSGVATVYTTLEQTDEPRPSGGPYRDYPISVAVRYQPAAVAIPASRPMAAAGKVRYTAFLSRLKPWLTAAVVAAALMPLALLFVHTSPAQGLTLAEVARAFAKAPHVHISVFDEPAGELIREFWISDSGDLCLMNEGQGRVLYDLGLKKKYRNLGGGGSAEVADMSDGESVMMHQIVNDALGFDFRNIPAGARWAHVPDAVGEAGEPYELAWTGLDGSGKRTFSRRYMITVDPATSLPREVRSFEKWMADGEWVYRLRTEFQYLTDDEMAAVMDR
jgi:hypothetical protein